MILRLLTNRRGTTSIEYAMLAGMVSIVIVAGTTGIGSKINAMFLGPLLNGLR